MLLPRQNFHKVVEQDCVWTIPQFFAVYVRQQFGRVVYHQFLIDFLEDWRDSGNFAVFW